MKKFFFYRAVFFTALFSVILFSSCNKEDSLTQDNHIKQTQYAEYEKYVKDLRMTYEDAEEIIRHNSTLSTKSTINELKNSTVEELIEKNRKTVNNLLENLSKFTVEDLDNKLAKVKAELSKEISLQKANNNNSSNARSYYLKMKFRMSLSGIPPANQGTSFVAVGYTRNGGAFVNFIPTNATSSPFRELDDHSPIKVVFYPNSTSPVSYNNITITTVLNQPHTLASFNGYNTACIYIPSNGNEQIYTIGENAWCGRTGLRNPEFYPIIGCSTGQVWTDDFGDTISCF